MAAKGKGQERGGGGPGPGSGGGAGAGGGPPQRTFTVESASATLPLVKVIIRDAMDKWKELGHLRAELADAEVHGQSLAESRKRHVREEVERVERDLEGCVREIAQIGASIKDFETGLVDFPMRRGDGKAVLLCWKAGETKIEWWHDQDSGFAGRRPISELSA